MFLESLYLGHGFGLNTDIFETNVINLAIVLAVLISVGGNALRDTLSQRKQTILDNLSVAEQREEEAKKNVLHAYSKLDEAEEECAQLHRDGQRAKAKAKNDAYEAGQEKIGALKRGTKSALRSERQRVLYDMTTHLIGASLERAEKHIRKRAQKPQFYDWVMDYKIKYQLDLRPYKSLFKPE